MKQQNDNQLLENGITANFPKAIVYMYFERYNNCYTICGTFL
jgi:hypothetical protein